MLNDSDENGTTDRAALCHCDLESDACLEEVPDARALAKRDAANRSSYDTLLSATKLADYPAPFICYDPNDPEKGADERRVFEEMVPHYNRNAKSGARSFFAFRTRFNDKCYEESKKKLAGEESLNLRRKTVGHLRDYYDEICSVTRAAVEMDPSEVAAAKALRLEQLSNHDAHPTAKGPEQHTDQQYGATLEPMPQAAFGQSDPSLWDTMDVSTDMEMCESALFRFPLPSASLQQQPMIVSTASTHHGVCTGCGLAPSRATGHTRELKNTKCPLPTCKCGRLKAVHRRFMVGPRCNLQPLDSNTGLAQRHTRLPDAEPTTSLAAPAQRHTRLPDAEPTTVKGRSARGLCSSCERVPQKSDWSYA